VKRFQAITTRTQRRRRRALGLLLTGLLWADFAVAQQAADAPVVASIDVAGNQFLQRETLLYYVSTKAGDRYDEQRLRDDFRRLWETGFLEDMVLDVRDSPRGKLVVFQIRERKRVQIVDFRGSKAVTKTEIEEALKKKEAGIKIDTFYDMGKAKRVEAIIKEMLVEKGRPFGTVKHDAKNIGSAGTQVSFIVDDGPNAKVKSISFEGNSVFSDRKLRGRMKKIMQPGFFNLSWLTGKTKYTEEKWSDGPEGDKAKLQDFYLDHGYVTASVGDPKITYTDGKSGFLKKKPVKWMQLEIPVVEGEQYRVGTVAFDGLKVFKAEGLRTLFKLETGDVYRESRIKKGFEKLRDVYGAQGYFQFTAAAQRKPDPERKVVDVVLALEEDKRYYVGKIRFAGNESTRDKVIRREIYLNEGDIFNTEALKLSVRRVNQLGYFKPMEGAPEFNQDARKEDHLDVTFKVEEQNRNQFQFGGGVSGLEGTFLNASFSTANFLGLGETLSLAAQTGKRTKNYQLTVSEPYLFDRPITAGFDLFKRKLILQSDGNYVGYVDGRSGLGLTVGLPAGRFSRVFTNYAFEFIDIGRLPAEFQTSLDTVSIDLNAYGKRRESRLSPSFVYNTVDNPWTPHRGVKLTLSNTLAGGPLGGSIDYVRPSAEAIWYIPHTKRTTLGLRLDSSYIRMYGDTTLLPYYLRFRLGGEQQVRGYNIQSIGPLVAVTTPAGLQSLTPRDANSQTLNPLNLATYISSTEGLTPTSPTTTQFSSPGGTKYVVFNAEYYLDVFGPVRLLFFFDAGQAFQEGESPKLSKLRLSYGPELRFVMPVLNVPFRLIYAFNPNIDPRDTLTQSRTFKFAVGTTF
jgi:outer membrane protein insertion porin family